MIVHVIGKNGYIASNLIPYLEEKGYEVRGYSRDDLAKYLECLKGIVINCASFGNKPEQTQIRKMITTNFDLPYVLFNKCSGKLIHLSSSSEIFQPHTAYARTKSLASDYLRGKATLCYLYTVWGGINQHPHTFMAALLKAKREGTPFNLSTPFATRDFVHIKHICRGIEELIQKPIGEYHFGTGIAWRMYRVAEIVGLCPPLIEGPDGFNWKASDPYFANTFKDDLKEELCK